MGGVEGARGEKGMGKKGREGERRREMENRGGGGRFMCVTGEGFSKGQKKRAFWFFSFKF